MNHKITFDNLVKDEILEHLAHCNSYWVWLVLPNIAVDLTHRFPIESVVNWLKIDKESDMTLAKLDDRSTSIVFLDELVEMGLEDAVRIPDGSQKPDVKDIVNRLVNLSSFDIAINTWKVVCRDWLAICYADNILETLNKDSNHIKPHVSIARIIVGALQEALY